MNPLKEHLSLLKKFLDTDFRKLPVWCTVGFLLSVLSGVALYLADPETANEVIAQFVEMVEESGVIDTETGAISVFALLQNNWTAMLNITAYGFLPFIYLSVISLFSNGALMGVLAGLYAVSEEVSLWAYFAGVLPHGIFEIPALVLSAACGMYLCRNMGRFLSGKPRPPLAEQGCHVLRVLLFLVAPMTVAAAFIEVYLTPMIQALFF